MTILERLQQELGGAVMERLGSVLGLGAPQTRSLGEAILPVQLGALARQVDLPGGAQKLLDMAAQVPQGTVQELVSSDSGIQRLRQAGAALLAQVMGNSLEGEVQRLSTQTGVSGGSVQGLMQMVLPLVLGWLGTHARTQGLNAAGLGGLFAGLAGAAGLGTLATAGTTTVISPVNVPAVTATPGPVTGNGASRVSVTPGVPVEGQVYRGPTGTMPHSNQALGRKPGFGWLWLLPLLLLLLLGGCFLLAGKPKAVFAVTDPVGGATVGSPFVVKGTGTAGETVTMNENGTAVASGKVADDGTYNLTVPSASAGEHTYALSESGNDQPLDLKLTATQPFSFSTPTASALLPDGSFTLSGLGKPGDVLDIFENGTSLGKATVGPDGRWSLTLPKLALGEHIFSIKGPGGLDLGNLKTSVQAAATALAGKFAVTSPAPGATLPTGAFTLKGTGKPGDVLDIQENGASVGKATVAPDGSWSLDVPALAAGAHTFSIKGPDGLDLGTFPLTLGKVAAGAFTLATPAAGATLPAGGFTMRGSGKPGDVLQVFEDGTSLGNVTVGADGAWTLDVPSPAAGAHTYTVKGPDGSDLGSVQATVAASAAGAGTATCAKPFSLSIKDGQTVSAPYRFGGVGSGKKYMVTVLRGVRQIGRKEVALDSTCGWSYTSNPGKGTVTYSITEVNKSELIGKTTLTVK